MARVQLRTDHTCGCEGCIKTQEAYADDHEASPYRDAHICACKPCISACNDMAMRRSIVILDDPHSCGCDACEYNQKLLAE